MIAMHIAEPCDTLKIKMTFPGVAQNTTFDMLRNFEHRNDIFGFAQNAALGQWPSSIVSQTSPMGHVGPWGR